MVCSLLGFTGLTFSNSFFPTVNVKCPNSSWIPLCYQLSGNHLVKMCFFFLIGSVLPPGKSSSCGYSSVNLTLSSLPQLFFLQWQPMMSHASRDVCPSSFQLNPQTVEGNDSATYIFRALYAFTKPPKYVSLIQPARQHKAKRKEPDFFTFP